DTGTGTGGTGGDTGTGTGGGTGGDTGTGTGGGTGGDTGTGGTTTPVPFSWDWTYADPSCTGLAVTYPADIPDGQANDANIRVETDQGQVTLNYHLGEGTWSGEHSFDLLSHPAWPAGVTSYQVTWTQVGGTNYHWQGSVPCVIDANGAPQAVTQITGWRTSTVSVSRGSAASADSVNLAQADNAPVVLQSLVAGRWTTLRTVVTDAVDARVTFPTQTRTGTFQYRLAVPRTAGITGATTKAFTVRVY
ncbi:MAG: hypothetical protein ACXVD0_08390, partial [Nocardioides sp.]